MNVTVDFEYGFPVMMTAYQDNKLFMKSEISVKIPARPYFSLGNKLSCTEKQFAKWESKVYNKIYEAVVKSFKESLYGEVELTVNGIGGESD